MTESALSLRIQIEHFYEHTLRPMAECIGLAIAGVMEAELADLWCPMCRSFYRPCDHDLHQEWE